MTVHPFTYDLPRGGRHVTPRAVAPIASLRTRVNQLMPVGLLVVATSTAVAVALPHGDSSAGAAGEAHRSAPAPRHHAAAGDTEAGPRRATGRTATHAADPAAATLAMAGKHRAPGLADAGTTRLPTTGKHRLGPKHTTHADPQHKPDPEPAATPSSAAASGSAAAPSAPSAPSTAPSPGDALGIATGLASGVLDGVGGLLGGPAS